ncbi:MAG TPA: 30S ribosomal protein S9 [Micromonosporaceae bacterium]
MSANPGTTLTQDPGETTATMDNTDAQDLAAVETPAVAAPTPAPPVAAPKTGRTGRKGAGERPVQTVGRRKEAIVRVRLLPGAGNVKCNGRDIADYFPSKVHQQVVKEPLVATETLDRYDVIANLRGGGVTGQAGALRMGIARALVELDQETRPTLKKAGFLTRDARETERKKYGLKKARKAPQYSKR